MKAKIINSFIKVLVNIFSIWFVFSQSDTWIAKILVNFGIVDQKATISIIVALGTFLSEFILLLIELLRINFINPINLKVHFMDNVGKKLEVHKIKLPDQENERSSFTSKYSIQISINEGSPITNWILTILGSDIRITYSSGAYDSEVTKGWLATSKESLYKDDKGRICYYWTESIQGCDKIEIENTIIYENEIIIKPNRNDIVKCLVNVKICSTTRKKWFKRFIFFLLKRILVKNDIKTFQIIHEK